VNSRETIARNFVRRYGRDGLERLIDALSSGESGQAIAQEFSVSRERVRQWKNAFGHAVVLYQVHPEVLRVLQEASDDEAPAT